MYLTYLINVCKKIYAHIHIMIEIIERENEKKIIM